MLLPLVKKGMDDFGPDGVELQVGDAVEVLLAAKNKAETAEEGGSAAAAPDGLGQKSQPRPSKAITKKRILHEFALVQNESNFKLGGMQLPNPPRLLLSNLTLPSPN